MTAREFIQNMIEPGESFGEFPLFDDTSYAASAITNKDSVVIRLSKASFLQLLKESPEIYLQFLKLFTERMRFKFLIAQRTFLLRARTSLIYAVQLFQKIK